MIVHTLKMCKGDAGPEQSLVLFLKLMPENQGHSGRLTVYVQTP